MKHLYDSVSYKTSKAITHTYSTSFSLGIKSLATRFHDPIYAIYGFVRLADEIVDTFHDFPKKELLDRFEAETWKALDEKISLNPALNSFQDTVHSFQISPKLIQAFLHSMRLDLEEQTYDREGFEEYIYGSAEVVGLMCLHVFTEGDKELYKELEPGAKRLGAAFQKVNFLRDVQADFENLGRAYFPNVDLRAFSEQDKKEIEAEIAEDFRVAYESIKRLPKGVRFGVEVAYFYYMALFRKIRKTPAPKVMHQRIRVPNLRKAFIWFSTYFKCNVINYRFG